MPFSYPQVVIATQSYDSYIDLADALEYLAAQFSDDATAFLALTTDDQGRCLVAMTRTFDRQRWQGTRTDDAQGHQFPRTGLQYADGTPVDPDTIPGRLAEATAEGAAQIANGSTLQSASSTANLTKTLKAGSVEIDYFRDANFDAAPRFPQVVQELIGMWLGGAGLPIGSISAGTDGRTAFKDKYDVKQGF